MFIEKIPVAISWLWHCATMIQDVSIGGKLSERFMTFCALFLQFPVSENADNELIHPLIQQLFMSTYHVPSSALNCWGFRFEEGRHYVSSCEPYSFIAGSRQIPVFKARSLCIQNALDYTTLLDPNSAAPLFYYILSQNALSQWGTFNKDWEHQVFHLTFHRAAESLIVGRITFVRIICQSE